MSVYEFAGDSHEQLLWEDLMSYGCRVLINPPETEVPVCYLSPEERDRANVYLQRAGMSQAERIGVGFVHPQDEPVTPDSAELIPYAMFLSSDGVVTSYSLASSERFGRLLLYKELAPPAIDDEQTDAPAREQLDGAGGFKNRKKFEQILHRGGAYLASEKERRTLLRIFGELA